MPEPLQQTLDQERARQAWDAIQHIKGKDFEKKYGSLVRRVPMLVLMNGLGQTLAFLRSKGKDTATNTNEHVVLFEHLSDWTMRKVSCDNPSENLLDWICHNNSIAYRQATAEALAYLVWLKRFAEAELPQGEE